MLRPRRVVEHHEQSTPTVFRQVECCAEQPLRQRWIADIFAPQIELVDAIGEPPTPAQKIEDLRAVRHYLDLAVRRQYHRNMTALQRRQAVRPVKIRGRRGKVAFLE